MGCYNDDGSVIETPHTSHRASELTGIIKSITAHDGSFDDHIDNSSCYSLIFPYLLNVNGQQVEVYSIEDLEHISVDDDVDIIFPVQTIFFNYEVKTVHNLISYNLLNQTCMRDFTIRINNCIHFEYPITVKIYNDFTRNFYTSSITNDKEMYLHFDNLHANDLFEIDYPVSILNHNNSSTIIHSNQDFTSLYFTSLEACE